MIAAGELVSTINFPFGARMGGVIVPLYTIFAVMYEKDVPSE